MSQSGTFKKTNPGNKPGKKNQVSNKKQMLQSAGSLITQNKHYYAASLNFVQAPLHELRRITRINIPTISKNKLIHRL